MNCDQVFDVLTRGPFPTGTSCDTLVETHLRGCGECRRLAEALRPALELFQETVAPEESRDLPGYWCAVATDRAQPVVAPTKALPPRRAARRDWSQAPVVRHFSPAAVWRLAAALLLGASIGAVFSARGTFNVSAPLPPGFDNAALALPDDEDDRSGLTISQRMQLAALPAACFRHRPDSSPRYSVTTPQVLGQADLTNLTCCTDCHNFNSDVVTRSATAVSQSCQICHKQ
jgi:hypothetical protein